MAIKRWHVGRIVLLWMWGIAISTVLISVISRTQNFVPGFIYLGALLLILVALTVITWQWFGEKDDVTAHEKE